MSPVYDEELSKLEGDAASSGKPSSTGGLPGLAQYDPKQDADDANSGSHKPKETRDMADQLRREERQSAGTSSLPSLPGIGIPGVGGAGAALKTIGGFLWGSKKRKAATTGTTVAALMIFAVIWIFEISVGPFTFLHIGQILAKHFEPGQHQAEKRFGKAIFEMVYDPPDSVKNPVGDNRLTTLGYLMKNRTLAQLRSKGLTPVLKENGYSFDGFTIDPTNENSPYKDVFDKFSYDDFRTIDYIQSSLDPGGKLGLKFSVSDGKIFVQGNETLFSNNGIKAMSDLLVSGDHPFFDPVFDYIRVRNLSRWTISGNLHFISKLDAKVTSAKDAFLKKYIYDPIKNGLNGDSSDGVDVQSKDANGNVTDTPLEGGEGPVTDTAVQGFLTDPKSFASVAGGAAAAAAIICILQAINKAIGVIRYVQIFLPMMRWGSVMLSTPSQIKSGQDGVASQFGAIADAQFVHYDKGGNATDTWYDSASIRSTAGDTGGIDLAQSEKDMMSGSSIPWLAWTTSDAVNALCSTAAQVTLGIISVGLLFIPGVDIISAAVGAVAFGAISAVALHALPSILAGQGIDVKASGAQWGSNIDYGSQLMSNEKMVQEGGTQETQQEVNQQLAEVNAQNRQQFNNESLADRIFNTNDYRSIVGSMMDRAGVYNFQGLVAKIGDLPSIFGSLLGLPASIVSATAHATSPYQYPFPIYGFSDADVENPIVNQPFANADQVSAILDGELQSGDSTYIDKALNCFGVAITKGDQGWQAVPTTASTTDKQDRTYGVNPYDDSHYAQFNCGDTSDTNWLRVRVWIFDLANMEGYACSEGDQTSCENSGFTNTSSNTPVANGVKFFSQNDPRWINNIMWNGATIGSEGCVLAAESMAISTLTGKDETPVDINNYVSADHSQIEDPYGHYGLHSTGLFNMPATPANLQKVVDAVKSGAVVVMYAEWDYMDPFWGTSGHAEVIRGVAADGNLLVYDPWDLADSHNTYVPDPKYPNDAAQHGAKEWPQANFLNSNIQLNSRHPKQANLSFDIVTK